MWSSTYSSVYLSLDPSDPYTVKICSLGCSEQALGSPEVPQAEEFEHFFSILRKCFSAIKVVEAACSWERDSPVTPRGTFLMGNVQRSEYSYKPKQGLARAVTELELKENKWLEWELEETHLTRWVCRINLRVTFKDMKCTVVIFFLHNFKLPLYLEGF